jgi:phosphocarrier protein HPr
MVSCTGTVGNSLGLHARAAARFVKIAGTYRSQVKVGRGSRIVDGKSILGLLLLAAARGSQLAISAEGADEADALAALRDLAARGFEDP